MEHGCNCRDQADNHQPSRQLQAFGDALVMNDASNAAFRPACATEDLSKSRQRKHRLTLLHKYQWVCTVPCNCLFTMAEQGWDSQQQRFSLGAAVLGEAMLPLVVV